MGAFGGIRGPETSDVFRQQAGRAYLEIQGIRGPAGSVVLRMAPKTPQLRRTDERLRLLGIVTFGEPGGKRAGGFCLCNSPDRGILVGSWREKAWRLLPNRILSRIRGVVHIWLRKLVAEIGPK